MSHLPEFYKRLVLCQYLHSARIGECAGPQWKNVDFERRVISFQKIIVWLKGRPQIKDRPENGRSRVCFASDAMIELLQERLKGTLGLEAVLV